MAAHDGHRERLRRRFLETGLETFSPHEMLELLLFYAIPRRNTNPIAHALIDQYGSLSAVMAAPLEELEAVKGLGPNSAFLLKLVWETGRIAGCKEPGIPLTSTALVGEHLIRYFQEETEDVVCELSVDGKGMLLNCRRIRERGALSQPLDTRKLVENAILSCAAGVVLARNCADGDCFPTEADYRDANAAQNTLSAVTVQLLDYVLVAGQEYVSLRDSGFLFN